MRIATWNINSVRLRLPLVREFVEEYAADVLCFQETKCPEADLSINFMYVADGSVNFMYGTEKCG